VFRERCSHCERREVRQVVAIENFTEVFVQRIQHYQIEIKNALN
jgi:hypothetical protein